MNRAHDKETIVRQQAIIALVKLIDPEDDQEFQAELMKFCLYSLVKDPSASVYSQNCFNYQ